MQGNQKPRPLWMECQTFGPRRFGFELGEHAGRLHSVSLVGGEAGAYTMQLLRREGGKDKWKLQLIGVEWTRSVRLPGTNRSCTSGWCRCPMPRHISTKRNGNCLPAYVNYHYSMSNIISSWLPDHFDFRSRYIC
jgi:hypothetical protein